LSDEGNRSDNLTASLRSRLVVMEISNIKPATYNPHNPTEDDIDLVARSMSEFAYLDPIVVNIRGGKNTIVGGHLRLKSLLKSGFERVEVATVDLDETQERKLNVLLNHHARYDMELLGHLLMDLDKRGVDIDLLGIDRKTVEEFMKRDSLNTAPEGEFNPPDEGTPDSIPGHIYLLGRHRVMCGDCTKKEDVDKLFSGNEKCSCVVTDPPYGVDYNEKNQLLSLSGKENSVQTAIEGDSETTPEEFMKFTKEWAELIPYSAPNTFYCFINGKMLIELAIGLRSAGLVTNEYLVWLKNNSVLGRKDYLLKHEFILYGWKGTHKFYGKQRQSVLEYDKPHSSKLHPTMKPLDLISSLVTDGSGKDATVYDPFGGSGTTLIACEQTGRSCYMMEKDPHYVDVIRKRYQQLQEMV